MKYLLAAIAMLATTTANAGHRSCDLKHTRLPGSVNIVHVGDSIERVRKSLKKQRIGRSTRIDNGNSWTDLYFDSGELDTICREMK